MIRAGMRLKGNIVTTLRERSCIVLMFCSISGTSRDSVKIASKPRHLTVQTIFIELAIEHSCFELKAALDVGLVDMFDSQKNCVGLLVFKNRK
jgi:hypothetical protein